MASILGDSRKNRTKNRPPKDLESELGEMYENSCSEFVIRWPFLSVATLILPFSTPEQQDGGIEPPPVLSSRFFRFLNLP